MVLTHILHFHPRIGPLNSLREKPQGIFKALLIIICTYLSLSQNWACKHSHGPINTPLLILHSKYVTQGTHSRVPAPYPNCL